MHIGKILPTLIIVLMIIIPLTYLIAAEDTKNLQDSTRSNNHFQEGHRYNIQGWVYIYIEGEPYNRGYQYGFLASDEIIDMIKRCSNFGHNIDFMKIFLRKNLEKNYDELSKQWWDICRVTSIKNFWDCYPDELKNEIKGIADGVKARNGTIFDRDIDYNDILALNEFQNVWWSIKYIGKSIHPFRGITSGFKDVLSIVFNKNQEPLHCSAFIATGDATADGEIVVGHSTYFCPYIAQRCNIILDVKPTNGYRFIMTSFPGAIWSNEDYYQNEKGIILTETALPQGPWKKQGTTIGVRARKAIQYSETINEVIAYLKNENTGLIPDEWLIGDTKTGEIASIELALYNTPIKRTFDGFYWSCNIPKDKKVKKEIYGALGFSPVITKYISRLYSYDRDEKFIELEKEFYGKIDTKIAKEILATTPICKDMSDGKITNSSLMKDMRLLACMGNSNGSQFNPTDSDKEKFHGFTELPSNGWVEIYPLKSKKNTKDLLQLGLEPAKNIDDVATSYTTDNKNIYFGSLDGNIYALDASTGRLNWKYETGWGIATKPAVSGDLVYVGSLDNNFYALEKNNGENKWTYSCKAAIHSSPVVYGEYVFFGSDDGRLYALNKTNGELAWTFAPGYTIENDDVNNYITTPILSDPVIKDDMVYIQVKGTIYALDAQTSKTLPQNVKKTSASESSMLFPLIFLVIISTIILVYLIAKRRNKKR